MDIAYAQWSEYVVPQTRFAFFLTLQGSIRAKTISIKLVFTDGSGV